MYSQIVVLIGILVMSLGMLGFGVATTYVTALLARFLPGILNGSPVALKAMVGDSPDAQIQVRSSQMTTCMLVYATICTAKLLLALAEVPLATCVHFPAQTYGQQHT